MQKKLLKEFSKTVKTYLQWSSFLKMFQAEGFNFGKNKLPHTFSQVFC